MSPEILGALVGLAIGLVQYVALTGAANSVAKGKPEAEARGRADLLRAIARFDVLIFAVIGYFVGPLLLG